MIISKRDGGQRYEIRAGNLVVGFTNRKLSEFDLTPLVRAMGCQLRPVVVIDRQLDLFKEKLDNGTKRTA